jgi:hypothetical protein
LVGKRGNEHRHRARNIYVHVCKWFHEHEPDGDDHLHADGDKFRWVRDLYGYGHCKHGRQTSDQFVHSKSKQHPIGLQQHTELGDERRDQCRHYAGDVFIHGSERFHQREPDRDHHLHADGNERDRGDHGLSKGHDKRCRWAAFYHDYFVPGWNTRRGIRGMHD